MLSVRLELSQLEVDCKRCFVVLSKEGVEKDLVDLNSVARIFPNNAQDKVFSVRTYFHGKWEGDLIGKLDKIIVTMRLRSSSQNILKGNLPIMSS